MKRCYISLIVLSLAFFSLQPKMDIAPDKSGSGDCSLIQQANANVPPPIDECYAKQPGEMCTSIFNDKPGVCTMICAESDAALCQKDDSRKRPKCVPCDDQKKNCPANESTMKKK